MDPVLRAILLSWDLQPELLIILALAGTLYMLGWLRLRDSTRAGLSARAARNAPLAAGWRPVVYCLGLLSIGIAILSPIDVLSDLLFSMHMIQHLLLLMIAPPLLLVANPLPFLLWGLPGEVRRKVGSGLSTLISGKSSFRLKLRAITSPGIVWIIWIIAVLGWHDPIAYNAALQSDLVHGLEHFSFFLAGMLFWWHITGAGPRIHRPLGRIGRVALVLSAIPPNMLAGIFISFAEQPLYAYADSGLFGLSAIDDQQVGGALMWIPGSMMYIIAALILVARALGEEQVKPPLPTGMWGREAERIAPHPEK